MAQSGRKPDDIEMAKRHSDGFLPLYERTGDEYTVEQSE
jgi:hypothetical protein